MGLSITESRANDFPYPLALMLECDAGGGLFCREAMRYHHEDGYIGAHAQAMKDGWLERQGPQGRIWLCPACSGK